MNGYAAVYEPAAETDRSATGRGGGGPAGTVHAAETEGEHGLPVAVTMCGIATDDLVRLPQDQPADSFDTWYPPLGDEQVCGTCDKAVAVAA